MSPLEQYPFSPQRVTPIKHLEPASGRPPAARTTLRVATLNIAHGRGTARSQLGQIRLSRARIESNLGAVSTVLHREHPAVVALQEADGVSRWSGSFDHVRLIAELSDYPHQPHGLHVDSRIVGVRLRYGTALLSDRAPVSWWSSSFDAGPIDTKGFVVAGIEFDRRPLRVVSVHLDFKAARSRKKQARMLIAALRASDLPLVVMGDFNCDWSTKDALRLLCDQLQLNTLSTRGRNLPNLPSPSAEETSGLDSDFPRPRIHALRPLARPRVRPSGRHG